MHLRLGKARDQPLGRLMFGAVCVGWIVLHLWSVWRLPFSTDELKIVHLGFAAGILFAQRVVAGPERSYPITWLWICLAALSIASMGYFLASYEDLLEGVGEPLPRDVVAGTVWVGLIIIATWLAWGRIIPLLVLAAMGYALFGHHLGGVLFHSGIDYARLIGYSSTYFMGSLGTLCGLSAKVILHFLLFGALFQALGGEKLIEKLSIIIGTKFQSGTAQTAVISSAMLGTVSSSIPANVAITGTFTIPMMIRRGYSREFAGAVEAAASSGGQITPPILSIVAFLIVGMTGIPYTDIVIASALPALVYYVSVSVSIVLHTRRKGIGRSGPETSVPIPRLTHVFKEHGHLAIPVIVLTWRILAGESPARAASYSVATLVMVGLLHAAITSRGRILLAVTATVHRGVAGVVVAAKEAAKIGVILGAVGIVMEVFTITGFGQRVSYAIVSLAGGGTSLLLVCLVALLVLFFGMGMPTAGAYLVAVMLTAPALINLGFPELGTHMFLFYYAMLSAITPPVCLGIFVAVSISGGRIMQTALVAMRIALPAFIMPFLFLYKPETLGLGKTPEEAVIANLLALTGLIALAVGFEGCIRDKLSWSARTVFLVGGVMLFTSPPALVCAGLAMITFAVGCHYLRHRAKERTAREISRQNPLYLEADGKGPSEAMSAPTE